VSGVDNDAQAWTEQLLVEFIFLLFG